MVGLHRHIKVKADISLVKVQTAVVWGTMYPFGRWGYEKNKDNSKQTNLQSKEAQHFIINIA
jgi:hypothetical protein